MLEDDQKFEELESKLAALSSQVEDLEQETEVDPFFEDDVRRVIDDFKSRELAGLESEDEDFDDDDDSSSDDFISVQTTGGPSFKTHWIAPTSCNNMTRDLARDAFVQGAADRYGTSQQVNNGDVLILLCREPVAEEPEEGSEAEEPEPPKKICRYVGLAYNTLVHPASTEPPSETEELISAPVGNYEIFVWSSCECSDEPAETVEVLVAGASSGDSDSTSYLKLGSDSSGGYDSGVLDFLTDVEVAKDNVESDYSDRGLTIDKDIVTKTAGLYGGLTKLSTKLTNWYVDYSKLKIKVKSDVGNLMSSAVQSGGSLSTKLLSAGECGNLTAVDPAEPEVLSILAAGSADDVQATVFNKNVEVSLGNVISVDVSELENGPEGIPSTELSFSDLTTGEGEAATAVNIFLPTISDNDAGKIETAVGPLSFLSNYDVSIEARYIVIYESESEGDAEYRIYKKEASNTGLTFASGLLTNGGTASEDADKVLLGVIRVSAIPLTYGCDPDYGCQPDPAGEFFDSSCGSGCPPPSELLLRYRPKNIWRYIEESRSSGTCYEELDHHELDPTQSTKTTQGYTNGGEFKAELVGGEQVDNFYVNGALIPFDDLYFAELPAEQLCYELTFRPSSVQVYFKAHDPSQPDNFCLRLVSEHLKEAGDTTDQTQGYTNGGEMREVVSVGAGGVVTTKPIFYVDTTPRDPDAAGSSWVLGFEGVVPTVAALCSEVSEINYSATGGKNTFSDTISYAETQSPTKVSVSLQYNDINNVTGSSYRFVDSSGAQLDPLESYVYAEGNDPLLFTLEIPQGSTGLDVYMNDQGSAGSSAWDINLTAQ